MTGHRRTEGGQTDWRSRRERTWEGPGDGQTRGEQGMRVPLKDGGTGGWTEGLADGRRWETYDSQMDVFRGMEDRRGGEVGDR